MEEIHGDEWGALHDFLAERPDLADQLVLDIKQVLDTARTDADIEGQLARLGCQYLPPQGLDHRAWLEEFLRRTAVAAT